MTDRFPTLSGMSVCELSSSGPLVEYLKKYAKSAHLSEYRPDVECGMTIGRVRSEDVQHLTYPDDSFDLVTHSEVMEHVPDDARSFVELKRVLRANGTMIFTVPLSESPITVERATVVDGTVTHLLEPSYHTDPWRNGEGVLAFRDYGMDIKDRLRSAGFAEVEIIAPVMKVEWIHLRRVVVATARWGNPDFAPLSQRSRTERV